MSLNGLRYGGQMPSKPLPDWLFYPLFWLIVPPAIVVMITVEMARAVAPKYVGPRRRSLPENSPQGSEND